MRNTELIEMLGTKLQNSSSEERETIYARFPEKFVKELRKLFVYKTLSEDNETSRKVQYELCKRSYANSNK